jgi:hypothetical protein
MSASKLFQILGLCLVLSGLAACSLPTPQDRVGNPAEAATFFIEKSEAQVMEQTQHTEISLTHSKSFNFKVCLKDQALSKSIHNHKFEITGGAETQESVSDPNGCIKWSEKIGYNHLAPAKWVELVREIKAVGMHQGARKVSFAINPWEDQGLSLQDKKVDNLVKAEQSAAALKAETDKGLWLDEMRLTVNEKTPGSLLGIELRAQASFSLTKSDGKASLEPISRGNFKIEFTLINSVQKDKQEIRTVLGQTEAVTAKIVGGYLTLSQEVQMSLQSVCSYGQLLMAVKLTPQVTDLRIAPFEGVYANIGECDQLKGSFIARLKTALSSQTEGAKSIAEFLGVKDVKPGIVGISGISGVNPVAMPSGAATPMGQAKVIVKDPLTFSNIGFSGRNSYQREKTFEITACFQGPIDYKALRSQNFTIRKINGQSETRTSLSSGCVTWEDSVTFHYLDKECWLQKTFQIRNDFLQMNETLTVEINPWDEGTSSLRDSRKGKKHLECVDSRPQFVLSQYDFDTQETQYPVDEFLGIKVQRRGILRLSGRINRPTLKNAVGTEDAPLPPGRYLLRWAIVDNVIKDFSKASGYIYQAAEKEVQLEAAGTIAESLIFETANIKALGELNHILIEVEPREANANLVPETYIGSIVLADRKEPGNLTPMGEHQGSLIRKLMAQFQIDLQKQKEIREKLSDKTHLANQGNLILVNLNNEQQTEPLRKALSNTSGWMRQVPWQQKEYSQFPTALLREWVDTGSIQDQLGDRLCYYWFYDFLGRHQIKGLDLHLATQECRRQMRSKEGPEYFDIEYRYIVQKVSKLEDYRAEIEDKTVVNSFYLSYIEDFSRTFSADVNAGFNTGKSFISPFSLGGGFRYQWAWVKRESSGNTTTIQSSTQLQMEKLRFKMRAEAYEKCAVIRLKAENAPAWMQKIFDRAQHKASVAKQLTRGYLICQGEVQNRPIEFLETFTVLNQKLYGTQMVNANSDMARGLFMTVRGEKDYQTMLKGIAGELHLPNSSKSWFQSTQSVGQTLAPAFQEIPLYPRHFISPR